MKGPHNVALDKFGRWVERTVYGVLQKYGEVPVGKGHSGRPGGDAEAPYHRKFDPRWLYRLRLNSSLINNSIEEKVNQTLRRGWAEWEQAFEAKCPECEKEFGSETPFHEQYDLPEDVEIDFDSERVCPNCEEKVFFEKPQYRDLKRAKEFFERANRSASDPVLEPPESASVSQSLLEVLREISWDIESFDDGWAILNRAYRVDDNGRVQGFRLDEVYRAPPERMHYSVDEDTGKFGGEYWVCIRCREEEGHGYFPEREPGSCSNCGNTVYPVFAYLAESHQGNNPINYYIRGEFLHRSQYEPGKFYGYSPIVSLWEEARTLEQMDKWYKEAYEQRRAPRGALAIKSSNAQSTRNWNQKQFEKMQNDPNHIPTLMDDGESDGKPIEFINLLESPAEMQHMEMRKWFMERISAKWGVQPIFQGAPSDSGLSQSMEVMVSNRAADRLRTILNEGFIQPILAQLNADEWSVGVAPVEEEDEQGEIELQHKHLQAAQQAASLGLDVEWTEENRALIKSGNIEVPEEGMGEDGGMGGGGMGDLLGGGPGPGEDTESGAEGEQGGDDVIDLGGGQDAQGAGQSPGAPDMPNERDSDQKSDE